MADTKLIDLTALTTPSGDDLLYIVDDPAGTPISKKITYTNLTAGLGGSGGMVLLEQHTASADPSLNFTACITSAYDEYQIELINIIPATTAQNLYFRVSTDGGSTYQTTLYSYEWFSWRAAASASGGNTAQARIIVTSSTVSNSATWGVCGSFRFYNPLSTAVYKQLMGKTHFLETTITARLGSEINGAWESTTAVNAFQFLFASGDITSGTIRVYGLAK